MASAPKYRWRAAGGDAPRGRRGASEFDRAHVAIAVNGSSARRTATMDKPVCANRRADFAVPTIAMVDGRKRHGNHTELACRTPTPEIVSMRLPSAPVGIRKDFGLGPQRFRPWSLRIH